MSDKKCPEIQVWFKPGNGMMIRTDGLEYDHPMHPYNQIIEQGFKPELYGYTHPLYEKYKGKSRNELIEMIAELEKTVIALESHYA